MSRAALRSRDSRILQPPFYSTRSTSSRQGHDSGRGRLRHSPWRSSLQLIRSLQHQRRIHPRELHPLPVRRPFKQTRRQPPCMGPISPQPRHVHRWSPPPSTRRVAHDSLYQLDQFVNTLKNELVKRFLWSRQLNWRLEVHIRLVCAHENQAFSRWMRGADQTVSRLQPFFCADRRRAAIQWRPSYAQRPSRPAPSLTRAQCVTFRGRAVTYAR